MIQWLTAVSLRDNDALTLARGRALALLVLVFMVILLGLASIGLIDHDTTALINTAIASAIFVLVYVVNRSGRVQLAVTLLLALGTLATIGGAIVAQRPIPTLFFLGVNVMVAAAFGQALSPLAWAGVLSFAPFIINASMYGTVLAPTAPIITADRQVLPSIFTQELESLVLLWMLAGSAYLASRLMNQLLDQSRASTNQAIASNQALSRSEERFSKIFHASPVTISITSFAEARFIDANESFQNLLGYQLNELVGQTTADLRLWEYAAEREQVIQAIKQQGATHGIEATFRTKSGELRTVLVSTELIELGGEACVLAIGHDITERRRAEIAIRQSEDRFSKMFYASPVAIGVITLGAGRLIDVNDRYLEQTEYRREELIGRTTTELNLWAAAKQRTNILQAIGENGSTRDVEITFRTKTGAIREALASFEQVEIAGEQCILAMFQDITNRKQAELALRQLEARFSQVFQASPIAILISTLADGRYIDANSSFLNLCGYQRHEVIGQRSLELRLWANPNDRAIMIQTLLQAGAVRDQEFVLRTKTGELRDTLLSVELIELDGETCLVGLLYDVTERRRAEAALQESHELYTLIAEHSRDLIMLLDRQGGVLYASPSNRQVLGFSPTELIGREAIELIHPDDRPQVLADRAKLATQDHTQSIVRARRADGAWLWIETSSTLLDAQGNMLNVSRDITERKRLEGQLLQSQKMETIGRLAGGIAHDFNNLLTAITGYADLAIDELGLDSPARGDIQELRKAADRATALTRQLLTFARKQKIESRVLNLNQLILNMDSFIRHLIGENIELVARPASDLGSVRADASQIEQVIVNLVVNARDAMPEGGKLTIETANVFLDSAYAHDHINVAIGHYLLLAVSDTGAGMEAAIQAHLFEPFFTTKAPGQGTGLGLATCYGIIKQHGGYILPYSEVGHGTTMRVYLPCVNEPLDSLPFPAEAAASTGGAEQILLVEDESAVRNMTARVLREQGYAVLEACNGVDALAVAQAQQDTRIDLLITDVIMPEMGGIALAKQITALRPAIKVLFTSGYTDDALLSDGRPGSSVNFLGKPFAPAALADKVRSVLDG